MTNDFVHEQLSFKIIGSVFDVFNTLGPGLKEKTYQRAVAVALANHSLSFQKEVCVPLHYQGINIGKRYLDFLIDNQVILETKIGNYYSPQHIEQVKEYLKLRSLQLAILAYFGSDRVRIKRIVNLV